MPRTVLVVDRSEGRRAALMDVLAHPEVRLVEARDAAAARIVMMLDQPALCFVHEDEAETAFVAALAREATVVLTSEFFAGDDGRASGKALVADRGAHAFMALPAEARQVRRGAERVLAISYDWTETFDDASGPHASAEMPAESRGAEHRRWELTPDPDDAPAADEPAGTESEPAGARATATAAAAAVKSGMMRAVSVDVSSAMDAIAADATTAATAASAAGGPGRTPGAAAAFDASIDALNRTYETLEWANYYDVLAVERHASAPTIKRAFLTRAARWHPDGFAASEDARLRERAYAVYKRMAEAYRVLGDPRQRLEYDKMLNRGQLRYLPETRGPALRPEDALPAEARRFYLAGMKALAAGDRRGARNSFKVALGIDPGSELIRARLVETRDPAATTDSVEMDASDLDKQEE